MMSNGNGNIKMPDKQSKEDRARALKLITSHIEETMHLSGITSPQKIKVIAEVCLLYYEQGHEAGYKMLDPNKKLIVDQTGH